MLLPNTTSFTIKSLGGLLRVLITDIQITSSSNAEGLAIKAIWDTGASGSAITKKVVQQLGLVPTGMARVITANGIVDQNTYTVNIALPNRIVIQNIIVTEIDALNAGCDGLIGMDVITLGDFSITNHKGITCMSFRLPSNHEIDYVKNINYGMTPISYNSGKSGSNQIPPKKKRK